MIELLLITTVSFFFLLFRNAKHRQEIYRLRAQVSELEDSLETVSRALRATEIIGFEEASKRGFFKPLPQSALNIVEKVYKEKITFRIRRGSEKSPF